MQASQSHCPRVLVVMDVCGRLVFALVLRAYHLHTIKCVDNLMMKLSTFSLKMERKNINCKETV